MFAEIQCKTTSKTKLITKKANASKLKEAEYLYVLQPETDHQGIKILFTDIQWIAPYLIEKVLLNNNYLVRKNGTNKTQVLHRMQMRKFTPHKPIPDNQITPQYWMPDPEMCLKHDGFYARAWEWEYEKPIFDAENNNATPPNSPEIPVKSDIPTEETRNTPKTTRECSPEIFPETEEFCDVTNTYPGMEHDAEIIQEQPNNSPTNPRSSKYKLRQNPKLNCNDDYRY